MSKYRALIDANVWYSAVLRDSFIEFAYWDFYKPLWSNEIFNETKRNLETANADYAETFSRHSSYIIELFPDGLVVDYSGQLGSLTDVHIKDEHVLASAVIGNADAIVTFNTKDFPSNAFEKYGLDVVHPDDFLLDQFFLNPQNSLTAIARLLTDYSNPALTVQEYASRITAASCPKFAMLLLENESVISQVKLNLG